MKELSIEQKARAYDEALKVAVAAHKDEDKHLKATLERIFPELVESKDEKIRKAIYDWIYTRPSQFFDDGFSKEEMLAWLKKQGEQILANSAKTGKDKPKFHEGEWIISNDKKSTYQVIEVKRGIYVIRDNADDHEYHIGIEACERSGRLWTIEDAKPGDVLYSPCCKLLWIYKDDNSCYVGNNLSYNENCVVVNSSICIPSDVCPASKEQRDQLEKTMADAGYTFDFEKKATSSCQEHCKGFQETEKCFADGDCKAKTAYKDEPKEDNRPVTERIKTFDDALEVLGDEHPLVKEYWGVVNIDLDITQDLIAYLKLRIVVAALNDGWEPKFEKGEYRFFPWFYFYNKEQYDELDVEEKERCVLRSGRSHANAYCGFVGVNAYNDASSSSSYSGSRLVFRTRELAAYAGRQFTEEWADFVFKTE